MSLLKIIKKIFRGMDKKDYIKPENLRSSKAPVMSPSRRYSLTVEHYKTGDGTWDFTRGLVKKGEELITEVVRNYCSFWHAFIQHVNGAEYFLCGENYMGYSAINLDTRNRIDYLPKEAKDGAGFCWVSATPSPDSKYLAVEGCYWGAPYEVVIFDFSNPEVLPYPEIARFDTPYFEDTILAWENGALIARGIDQFRISDGKNVDELPGDEREPLFGDDGEFDPAKVGKRNVEKILWKVPE